MTHDEHCLEAIKQKRIMVDMEKGIVFSPILNKVLGTKNTKGYIVSTLHVNGERKQIKQHRIIWIAKHGIPPVGTMIDHINRKKEDNRISNLRLVDDKGNAQNRRSYEGEQNPAAKITRSIVENIRQDYEKRDKNKYHHEYSYRKLAKKYEVSTTLIAKIIRKEIWKI